MIRSKVNTMAQFARKLALSLVLSGLVAAPMAVSATDAIWTNAGIITAAPQVDAVNVINLRSGNITNVLTVKPVEFSNAQNITNLGTMSGTPGWWFNQSPADRGYRLPLNNFHNRGLIESLDALSVNPLFSINPSKLFVMATNIVNEGYLRVGANGWLLVNGTNVSINRGALEVPSITPIGNVIGSNIFWPDVGMYDNYWAQYSDDINTAAIWDGLAANAPMHIVDSLTGALITQWSLFAPLSDCISNAIGTITITATNEDGSTIDLDIATNMVKQAVFVGGLNSNPNLQAYVSYAPSTVLTNDMLNVEVMLVNVATNTATMLAETNFIFFYDMLAGETNRGLSVNQLEGTARPGNYIISRLPEMLAGIPGQGTPDPSFLYNPQTFTNRNALDVPTAAYSAYIINTVDEPIAIPAGTVTNVPGRVQIIAENLDLNRARIRGEGEIRIKANHLLSSSQASLDCENVSMFLGSRDGLLTVTNLAKEFVDRVKGYTYAWSAVWQNQMQIVTTNYSIDTNGAVLSPLTNTAVVQLHCLLLDASELMSRLPVLVHEFQSQSTNTTINDNMTVVQSFYVDGASLTLNGNLTLSNRAFTNLIGVVQRVEVPGFVFTNAPALMNFTNNGKFAMTNEAHFGDDRPLSYSNFVNKGTISAYSINLSSKYFQNSGTLRNNASMFLAGVDGSLENGQSLAGGDTVINCSTLKLSAYSLSANGAVDLNVSGAFFDSGPLAANYISSGDGLRLWSKPPTGDLLGTTIQCKAPPFVRVDHFWPGQDRQATASGYLDNIAVGLLQLGPVGVGGPLLYFMPAGPTNNALYVDFLDLSILGDQWDVLFDIAPNMKIYYAAAKVGFAVPSPYLPEEYLMAN